MTEGCDIAFQHNDWKKVRGILPANGETIAEIRMLDIPGCLSMKGIVLGAAYREKDAYDIYTVITECLEDEKEVARRIKPLSEDESMKKGITNIREKFRSIHAEGPTWAALFLEPSDDELRKRAQAEVYVRMQHFLRELED